MAAKPPLRVGIIGSGFVALTHAEALKHIPEARLVAIAGGSRAGELAAQYGVRAEADVDTLIRAPEVEAVVVCSPHFAHAPQTVACLQAGKHVLVEKPMAVSVAECQAMIAAAEQAGRTLMVAHFQRFREPNAAAARALREGQIGTVRLAQQRLLELPNDKPWQLEARSVGFFLGYGVHGIDLLRFWIGAEVTEVTGFVHRLRGNPTEDGAQALLQFSGGGVSRGATTGATASLLATDSLPEGKSRKSPGAAGLWSLLIGDQGTLEVDSYGETVLETGGERKVIGRLPTWTSLTSPERIRAYREQDQAFVEAVLRGTAPPISGAEGLKNVAVACALYESARTGAVVRLGQ